MSGDKPKRRPRYSGKHPRRFEEKYKERDPARYAEDVAKVLASGKTPAGMHVPIMLPEILEVLRIQPGETVVDCTLGYGGHARELLAATQPGGRMVALDQDPIELPKAEARLRALGFPSESLAVHRSNYAGLAAILGGNGADALLADLGLSSMQIDDPARGFTFKTDAPLDMRMNPQLGVPASALLDRTTPPTLATWLAEHGDEPCAEALASMIHTARPISTTTQLAGVIRAALKKIAPRIRAEEAALTVRRVFQAIRIAVNDEFGALDMFLRNLPQCMNPRGRIAMLTFHSGEDRRVKQAFKAGLRGGVYSSISDEVVRATPAEQRANPRSAPAKLRWAIRA